MDLALSTEDLGFVKSVRDFFSDAYPSDILEKMKQGRLLSREDHVRSQQALQQRQWLGIGWPAEHGGTGWSPLRRFLFERELEMAGAPNVIPMAVIYIGPIICAFGTPDQQARWLPDILSSRSLWAQGYSEPEAGSDLASLQMTAHRDGDDYILNGTKIWTSGAHWADWIFCLVRTSREKRRQDGISLVCVPMNAPGVKVHPIISIDGTHELNSVTFDDVRTPISNRIGQEGNGWHYANVLLASERVSYAHIGRKKADLAEIRVKAGQMPGDHDETMLDDPVFATRLRALELELDVLELQVLRTLMADVDAAAVASLKISCTEAAQAVTELWLDLSGRYRAPYFNRNGNDYAAVIPKGWRFSSSRTASYLFERAQSIYGGSNEIQKNIIWKLLLKSVD